MNSGVVGLRAFLLGCFRQEAPEMTATELAQSAETDAQAPAGLCLGQKALWLCKAGNWEAAHGLCDEVPEPSGSWIHAYLHREEGDLGNASYWYQRAGREMPSAQVSLAEEWGQIAAALS